MLRVEGTIPSNERSNLVNLSSHNAIRPARVLSRRMRLAATAGLSTLAPLALSASASAQDSGVQSGGIGEQVNKITAEGMNAGGTLAGGAMYLLALIVFVAGVWALWKSRQPQNRESGYVGMGLAGLLLCGLLVTGGTWINKAARTASGTDATANSTAKVVQFGAGGGG